MTAGYVLLGPYIDVDDVTHAIRSQFPLCSHPLLIPTILTEIMAADLMDKLTAVHADLANIENKTGFGDWRSSVGGEPLAQDYRGLSRTLGALNNRFAWIHGALQCATMTADFRRQEILAMKSYVEDSNLRPLESVKLSLLERIEVLSSNLKHMQLFAGISQRLNVQQDVVSSALLLCSL